MSRWDAPGPSGCTPGSEELGGSTFMLHTTPFDAEQECAAHGRLPTDRTAACGCFPGIETPKPYPDLMTTLKRAEEAVKPMTVDTDHTQQQQEQQPAAPFGYKADGTARKRPAPSAEQMRLAAEGRTRAAEQRRAERAGDVRPKGSGKAAAAALAATPTARIAPPVAEAPESPLIARFIAEIDAEMERLTSVRQTLVEAC